MRHRKPTEGPKPIDLDLKGLRKVIGELQSVVDKFASKIEKEKRLLDVILVDEGPEPINIIRELKNRDVASLAELRDAMSLGYFKVGRSLCWKEANDLANKLRFWKGEVLIVPAGIQIDPPKEEKKGKSKRWLNKT